MDRAMGWGLRRTGSRGEGFQAHGGETLSKQTQPVHFLTVWWPRQQGLSIKGVSGEEWLYQEVQTVYNL